MLRPADTSSLEIARCGSGEEGEEKNHPHHHPLRGVGCGVVISTSDLVVRIGCGNRPPRKRGLATWRSAL